MDDENREGVTSWMMRIETGVTWIMRIRITR